MNFVARRSEETVAKFCSEAYAVQQQEGRGAHLEVNATSAIWATDIWADVVGYEARVDLCRFGQQVRSQNGHFMGCSNSSVRIRSTSRRLVEEVGLRCLCSKPHAAASAVAVRGPQLWNMAKAIAEILSLDDEQIWTVDATEPDYWTC